MPGLSPVVQSILYAVITKSIGSVYRVVDDLQAPRNVLNNTIQRESILLALTTFFTTATQVLFTSTFAPFLKRSPRLAQYELLLRAGASAIGLLIAETVSRWQAPKDHWKSLSQATNLPEGRTVRLSPQPLQSPVTFARTFSHRPPVNLGGFSL